MIYGRSIIHWIILAFIAVCVFIIAKWLIPLLFGLIGVAIPDQIVVIASLLIAVLFVYGGYNFRSTTPAA
jgi:hypothetical protein